MSSDTLPVAYRLFDELVDLPAERREHWIDEVCTGNADLAAELRRLLRAHLRTDGILDESFTDLSDRLDLTEESNWTERIGEKIGVYRIIGVIGRGGMGVVYRAERMDAAFSQTVALKLMRSAFSRGDSQDRFLLERSIQSKLVHSHIARLIDGGLTERGEPWFAMEYVEGDPLLEWCDQRHLGISGRLHLWMQICDAISFAHGQLVVHRDIKPSNVFVDAESKVKVLDFGIAKMIGGDKESEISDAESIGLSFTPQYAAPEQIRGEFTGTSTDIYALGMLLRELLCGRCAFGRRGMSSFAVQQQVLHNPLPRMTQQLFQPASPEEPDAEAIAAQRGTHAKRLRHTLAGDLQYIVDKATQKDHSRRYASVHELSDDVRRYLACEPVSAAGISWEYRLRKYGLRHRIEISVAATIFLSLMLVVVTSLWQRNLVQQANENLSEQIERNNAVTDVFATLLHSLDKGGNSVSVQELMTRAQKFVLASPNLTSEERTAIAEMILANSVQDDTEGAAKFLQSLLEKPDMGLNGNSYTFFACRTAFLRFTLKQDDEARQLLEKGKARAAFLPHGENNSRVECLVTEALLNTNDSSNKKRLASALDLLRQAIKETNPDDALSDRWNLAATARLHYGDILALANRPAEARASYDAALTVMKRWHRDNSIDFAEAEHSLAMVDQQRGQPLLAAREFERAADKVRDIDPIDKTLLAEIAMAAAIAEMDLNRLDHALTWLNEAGSIVAQLSEDKEGYVALLGRVHARALAMQDKVSDALSELNNSKAVLMSGSPKGTRAEAAFRLRAIEYEIAAPSASPDSARLLKELSVLEADLRTMGDPGAELLQKTLLDSAELLYKYSNVSAAEAKAVEAKKMFDESAGSDSWMSAACDRIIAEAELGRGDVAAADATFRSAEARLRAALGPDHPRTRETNKRMLELRGPILR